MEQSRGGKGASPLCGLVGFIWHVFLVAAQAAFFGWVTRWSHSRGGWEFFGWCSNSHLYDCQSPQNLFHESNVTALKVIAPSLGQTGTTTVISLLREMGWERAYHADDFSITAKSLMLDNMPAINWANSASRCRMSAISLEPITDAFPLALAVSPQAKVILTWRDFAAWLKSTSTGGQVKDRRTSYIQMQIVKSRAVFPYFEYFDQLTGVFERWRRDGPPALESRDIIGFLYRVQCNGYAWPPNDVYNRGTYKVQGQEEAYLAHIDEIRRLTPPDRLLEVDVKKATRRDFEKFLGLPLSDPKKSSLPRTRNKHSRTNDPWMDIHWDVSGPAFMIFMSLHAVNYLFVARLPAMLILSFLGLICRCCCARSSTSRDGAATSSFSAHPPEPRRRPLASSSEAEERYHRALRACPVVAILRGLVPSQALNVGKALVEAGVTIIEVPLNSPNAIESIRILVKGLPENIAIGAGTVLTEEDVVKVAQVGGILIVSPNMDPWVIKKTRDMGLVSLPGVATVTEALAALSYGASGLKAFPGEHLPPKVLKAWRAVLPKGADLLAVGGVTADNMAEYWSAGVNGFGVGSALFRPGDSAETIRQRAEAFVQACPRRD